MSKVEVKKGDTWDLYLGDLYQQRGRRERVVIARGCLDVGDWEDLYEYTGTSISSAAAKGWIKELGGTVVEEREEEKAVKVVAYACPKTGGVVLCLESSEYERELKNVGSFYRIHIAGVTA